MRGDGEREFLFLLNFTADDQQVDLGRTDCMNALTGVPVASPCHLPPYGIEVLTHPRVWTP